MKKKTSKVTETSADLNYEAMITEKAHEYAPMMLNAFNTQTALLIAIDNSTRFLRTAYDALDGYVTADYFCKHSPLSEYPDQLLALMVIFIESGIFYPTDASASVFSLSNAHLWKFRGLE